MGVWEIIVAALVLVFSVLMIIVIILQEGHEAGLGTITGGADSFLSRGKARTADAIFARITKYCALLFFVLVVLLNAMQYFNFTGAPDKNVTETSVVSDASTESSAESKSESKTESSAESKSESKTESSAESKTESKAESKAESKTESSAVSNTQSGQASANSTSSQG